jgi:ABC-type antimicrobial peptide transport system permease subunit
VNTQAVVTELQTTAEMVKAATRQPAFRMTLLFGFAAISLFLAAIGIYGLVTQAVTQRRREIAIRVALGARPSEVVATLSRRALAITMIGLAVGIVGALMSAQVLESLLYGVRPNDATSFLAAGAVLLTVAALAAFVPSLRATRVDPAKVLRGDF